MYILLKSAKHNMSSQIIGWLVGDWDGKKSGKETKLCELNLKRGNSVILPKAK